MAGYREPMSAEPPAVSVRVSAAMAGPAPAIDVLCVGNAIVDRVVSLDLAEVEALGLAKGSMTLIGIDDVARLGAELSRARQVSGGSAANTAVGVASFGGHPAFLGAVADDALGGLYAADLEAAGVVCILATLRSPSTGSTDVPGATGRCFVLVTPDFDRTMATYLGAARHLPAAAVGSAPIAGSRIVYVEGYMFDAPASAEALELTVATTTAAGVRLALSLSDPFVVERHRAKLAALVASDVDILFANEAEILALTGTATIERAGEALRRPGLVALLTRGEHGSLVVTSEATVEIPATEVKQVIDTTGAGDLYAAGALYGLARGAAPEDCARMGALAASEVISHIGARPEQSLAEIAVRAGLAAPR
jgi:sugar/nucleoside kinase (ribokinase family)